VLLLAAGMVGCVGDDAVSDHETTARTATTTAAPASGAPAVATTRDAALEAAFEFAECMRDHGIDDFADPQIRPDGDFFLSPPADVGDEELAVADATCAPIAAPFRTGSADVDNAGDDAAGWERIVPGGECRCADGSEFSFWVREADPDRVLVYLEDGGVCFSAVTCAPDRNLFTTAVGDGPIGAGGIFDLADDRNPFADHSIVYVPYCTGDAHLGNVTAEYAPGLTVHHMGLVNGTAALDHVVATAGHPSEVVVVGESAGAIAAPLYAGLVADRLPDARIAVLADGSGSYPDGPRIDDIITAWGLGTIAPPWLDGAASTPERSSVAGMFIASGRHHPDIVFARHDYAYDEQQQQWYPIVGLPATDLLALIDANEAQIEAAGVDLVSYVAPGAEHTALSDGTFYTEEVDGRPLHEWVTRLLTGGPVDDVHCTDCSGG